MSARTKLAVLSTAFLCAIGLGLVTLAARARSVSSVVGEARDDRPPTFNKDIAPIVFKNCAVCHHPGGSGPFNLLSYEDVSKRAQQIAIVTGSRFMPPWLPEPGMGGAGRAGGRCARSAAAARVPPGLAAWRAGPGGQDAAALHAARGRAGRLSQFRFSDSGEANAIRPGAGNSSRQQAGRPSRQSADRSHAILAAARRARHGSRVWRDGNRGGIGKF